MPDIVVFGATGLTGTLITRYLLAHSDKPHFTLGLAGRSQQKLDALLTSLGRTTTDIPVFIVDVSNQQQVDAAVRQAKVVINTVGPYFRWGAPVVRSCVLNGVHYVDLSGETSWTRSIIKEFHYAATKSKTIIVPSCAVNSAMSDIALYDVNRTLKEHVSTLQTAGEAPLPQANIQNATSAWEMKDEGFSRGSLETFFATFEDIPLDTLKESMEDYALSPAVGAPYPKPKTVYSMYLADEKRKLWGSFLSSSPTNAQVTQRTWGLHHVQASVLQSDRESRKLDYGPHLSHREFLVGSGGPIPAFLASISMFAVFFCFSFTPLRWIMKKFALGSRTGKSLSDDAILERGHLKITTLAASATDGQHPTPTTVKNTIEGKGDPYLLTSVIAAECGLSLLPKRFNDLPNLARGGGILTPASAFGEVIIERLKQSGRFHVESKVITRRSAGNN